MFGFEQNLEIFFHKIFPLYGSALTCSFNLFQSWPSHVTALEGEVAQLRLELKKAELNREELSAELRKIRKIKVEPGVSDSVDSIWVNVSASIPFYC